MNNIIKTLMGASLIAPDLYATDHQPLMLSTMLSHGTTTHDQTIGYQTRGPNIVSDLKWKQMDTITLSVTATKHFQDALLLEIKGYGGYIYKGQHRDQDFAANNRRQMYCESIATRVRGHHFSLSATGGVKIPTGSLWAITPKLGQI